MSEPEKAPVGSIGWFDLTVENADDVRDFYQAVVGWDSVPLSMGDYSDYCMNQPQDNKTVAGICHARGGNAGLPPMWLMYITVADLDQSVTEVQNRGGKVILGPKAYGDTARYCVIQDPAGAAVALFQP